MHAWCCQRHYRDCAHTHTHARTHANTQLSCTHPHLMSFSRTSVLIIIQTTGSRTAGRSPAPALKTYWNVLDSNQHIHTDTLLQVCISVWLSAAHCVPGCVCVCLCTHFRRQLYLLNWSGHGSNNSSLAMAAGWQASWLHVKSRSCCFYRSPILKAVSHIPFVLASVSTDGLRAHDW